MATEEKNGKGNEVVDVSMQCKELTIVLARTFDKNVRHLIV